MSIKDHRDRWPPSMQRTVAEFIEAWCTSISVDPEIDLWEILQEAYEAGYDDGFGDGGEGCGGYGQGLEDD